MSEAAALIVESKADFARRLGVSAGRVSQYISEGKLTAEAFEGEGPRAKVRVQVAMEQLNRRLDVAQRLGNGQKTRIDVSAFVQPVPAHPAARSPIFDAPPQDPTAVSLADRIQLEKLRELELRNREATKKELANRGEYVRTSDVAVGYARVAGGMMNVFEGALADFAQALAAKFEIPKRDALHLLRSEFRRVRENGANAGRRAAEGLPGLVIDQTAGVTVTGEEAEGGETDDIDQAA